MHGQHQAEGPQPPGSRGELAPLQLRLRHPRVLNTHLLGHLGLRDAPDLAQGPHPGPQDGRDVLVRRIAEQDGPLGLRKDGRSCCCRASITPGLTDPRPDWSYAVWRSWCCRDSTLIGVTAGFKVCAVSPAPAVTPSEIQPADVSIRDLEARWGLSRNGLKARARALGVELRRVSSTLTVWPGEFVEVGERLQEHLAAGHPLGAFPGMKPAISASTAPAVTALPADPLQRARGLAEAADAGLVLANDDLSALLVHGVTSWRDGHEASGYRFQRHQQGRQVLWTVARAITASTEPGLTAGGGTVARLSAAKKRRPGFAIDAHATVLSRLELPQFPPSPLF